ncbi:MAG: hypothetical protein MI748_19825 [Opitutales bacterium]|nr:hypothetical protein [Opitutales bacterium]
MPSNGFLLFLFTLGFLLAPPPIVQFEIRFRLMIAVDGHVHIHPKFKLPEFFNAAVNNLKSNCSVLNDPEPNQLVLFLTESKGTNVFKELKESASQKKEPDAAAFEIIPTQESNSLVVNLPEGQKLILIAGRQIVCAENLEVLALGCEEEIPDGDSIKSVIKKVIDKNAIVSIPWGFGKWMGGRRKIIKGLLESSDKTLLTFGDNGNRFPISGTPSQLKIAQNKGFKLLSGSDPLPLSSESQKVGKFGFAFSGELSESTPFESLQTALLNPETVLFPFGKLENLFSFIKNQFYMQYHKRFK